MLRKNKYSAKTLNLKPAVRCFGHFILILALALAIAGCAGHARISWPITAKDLPDQYLLNSIPFFPQEESQCGPAALAMALAWSGVHVSPQDLSSEVFTPSRKGSLQSAMIGTTRRHDRIACLLFDPESLIDEVAGGHPVIVLQNLGLSWYPVWHYAVVIGLDLNRGNVILHSGTTPQKQISFKVFENTWARSNFWGLLVLPPSQLPAVAKEKDYLLAVSNLERSGRWETAAEGYRTALSRWPDSLPAYMGLGVCKYETGDLKSAEAVFREATLKFPHDGAAFNNLAQVLMDQGRKTEALDAVMRAIERGGPLKAHFESTLEEIRNQ
ncbi:MAG: PA2778 family cysteine peptidase [Desulfosarcina sp.]|nr:PA2778 family cysteine peptidase [Desulfosarcina sp.]MBC2744414.1 PA2778 family cysteine peptidase [Desulfosarcina sp.]MBC2767322.1 PA2778 family cysteine peptidase [Desulfosarcina sp.]